MKSWIWRKRITFWGSICRTRKQRALPHLAQHSPVWSRSGCCITRGLLPARDTSSAASFGDLASPRSSSSNAHHTGVTDAGMISAVFFTDAKSGPARGRCMDCTRILLAWANTVSSKSIRSHHPCGQLHGCQMLPSARQQYQDGLKNLTILCLIKLSLPLSDGSLRRHMHLFIYAVCYALPMLYPGRFVTYGFLKFMSRM